MWLQRVVGSPRWALYRCGDTIGNFTVGDLAVTRVARILFVFLVNASKMDEKKNADGWARSSGITK